MDNGIRGKKHYRCHAHTNPFKDDKLDVPCDPSSVNWLEHFSNGKPPAYVDIGCGYGRFLLNAAEKCPEANVLGLEIREKVVQFVKQHTGATKNCSVIKTNALLFLTNYFHKHSISKIFVLFPDPHFKKRKQKGRMICPQMMQIMRYLLEENGELYISTDVESLFSDMCKVIDESGCFVIKKNIQDEPLFSMCYKDTDEAHRAGVKSGHTFGRVYRVI